MKKVLAIIAMLAIPGMAMAAGLQGDCYDCHTMHNSEAGVAVATKDGIANNPDPIENLLKFDCIACHANDPTGNDGLWVFTGAGGSTIPQVAHGGATDLAGGNFSYGLGGNGTSDKVHNVKELFGTQPELIIAANGNPPGMVNNTLHDAGGIFTTGSAYNEFSCAGARGCHGTRNQSLNSSPNGMRTGMAAIAGSHHVNSEGLKQDAGYASGEIHSGATVAAGYRFIPGLWGYGSGANGATVTQADRWQNRDANTHNEYYGNATAINGGCGTCHTGSVYTQAATTSMTVPNNSMSGFCSTCHGNFHSSGTGNDVLNNGTSGAFLRHPSDYVLASGQGNGAGSNEYLAYNTYDVSAPVARQTLAAASATVTPATDMVMCLSCHAAHGTPNDYLLRFDYGTMTAGVYTDLNDPLLPAAGCLACHTQKGIIQ